MLGFLPQEEFTQELLAAKALVAPSLGGESFGIVLVARDGLRDAGGRFRHPRVP